MVSVAFDDDLRRKTIMKALVFSEFRTQVLSVDFTVYDNHKYELFSATFKLLLDDLPQFILQIEFLKNTPCGSMNPNTFIYVSIAASLFSFYFSFLLKLINFIYSRKLFKSLRRQTDLEITNHKIENIGFKNMTKNAKENQDEIHAIRLKGTDH